jgi:hypothetical protein
MMNQKFISILYILMTFIECFVKIYNIFFKSEHKLKVIYNNFN